MAEETHFGMEGTEKYKSKWIEKHYGMLPAIVISDINNSRSTSSARVLIKSIRDTKSKIIPMILPATTPETLKEDCAEHGFTLDYTYPQQGQQKIDLKSGMKLTGYAAEVTDKIVSCLVSHMRCWQICISQQFPIIVLEHDAIFTRHISFGGDDDSKGGTESGVMEKLTKHGIVGLNSPMGATRKASVYYDQVTQLASNPKTRIPIPRWGNGEYTLVHAPWVDDNRDAPQGLAGNSAYFITPRMAGTLLKYVDEYGMWPNDALMCKQLFPNLKQIYPFVTKVQGIASTTTG